MSRDLVAAIGDGLNETPDAGGVAPAMSFVRKFLGADDREPLPTPHVEPAP